MDLLGVQIPAVIAMAAVATLGYLVGRRSGARRYQLDAQYERELRRAQAVARELEKIARTVREDLGRHRASLSQFRQRVSQLGGQPEEAAWSDLCREAEDVLAPTLRLATQIATAHDLIRQQTDHLTVPTDVRTDALTGVRSRYGLDDVLRTQFAVLSREDVEFSVVVFGVDRLREISDRREHRHGDELLRRVARLLEETARQTDVVARDGGEEFVVLMPRAGLEEAAIFAERVRGRIEKELPVTVSGGIATVSDGDTPDSLLARAGAALETAKSADGNCIFRHDGQQIESVWEEVPTNQG